MKRNSPEFKEHLRRIGLQKGRDSRRAIGKPFQKGHKINLDKRRTFTEKHKQNISKATKGRIPYNKGFKNRQEKYICKICKKEFIRFISTPNKKMYCSNRCRGIGMLGDKCPSWKGGTTPLRVKISGTQQYKDWRLNIFIRDNYTCLNCKKVGGTLQIHHLKSFSQIIKDNNIKTTEDALVCKELWEINNGITLCLDCHKQTENYLTNSKMKRFGKGE